MNSTGLSKDESIQISIVAPLIALIGPLVAAPLADRLGGGFGGAPRSKTGRYLRVMIAICLILATIFYWLLCAVPRIIRSPPNVSFTCDEKGGFILQDRCGADRICYNWGSAKGSVLVKNCQFSCNASSGYASEVTTMYPDEEETTELTEEDSDYSGYGPIEGEQLVYGNTSPNETETTFISHPHMCYKNASGDNIICEVFTKYSKPIDFRIGLKPTINTDEDLDDTCKYPFSDYFQCRINPEVIKNLSSRQEDCHPNVVCEIHDPYNNKDSLLKRSQCGYDNISFWLYLFIRSFADIFPAAAATLLATAVVIATRETSTGRGDVGKQFAAGALGFGIFAPIIGGVANGIFLGAMICFTILMVLAAIILLLDNNMPLSPPEWWWHTRCGLLALPMSSVREYGLETGALGVVLFLLGRCFGALFGGMAYTEYPNNFQDVHRGFTIAAGTVAVFYFITYHFYLKPKCAAPVHLPPDPAPAVVQSMNGNGSYTPLRVYHNSKSKKGHFRY
ncbi:hypothetical protein NQ314_005168 [Rhamnusium bicolor]|uniref:Major facilitator superfamily associated domain-containing protein n=1 Tax=Rhamnusium bicolor TaxID=1586634 RepID=A0AAV8ZJG9_9CUCU|nr:hypothetical protein NQ314_005168 [Rhamnusium bicolor]